MRISSMRSTYAVGSKCRVCGVTNTSDTSDQREDSMTNGSGPPAHTLIVAVLAAAILSFFAAALLINIFQRQQEAKPVFFRVAEVDDRTDDPAIWGKNFPFQYDAYRQTV